MQVVKKINSKVRIVKFPKHIYPKPYVVQKKTGFSWFNTPCVSSPQTFPTKDEAVQFAEGTMAS